MILGVAGFSETTVTLEPSPGREGS